MSILNHSPTIVRDGLILCLDAQAIQSYSGSGTDWQDLSGKFNKATISGSTFSALAGSGGGKYFDFDGTNDYMTISNPSFAANGFTSGLTCEAWLRFDTASLTAADTGFITRYQAGQQSQFLFGFSFCFC